MGTRTWIRIENRGRCPRECLEIFGAGDSDADDPTVPGQFRSGAKIAPIAALRLGITPRVSSADAAGPYFLTYGKEKTEKGGGELNRLVLEYYQGDRIRMPFYVEQAFRNWSDPIGDDPLREFPVWREYVNNARSADPGGIGFREVDRFHYAPDGKTYVYLPKTKDFEEILAHPDRYFKFLSKAEKLYTFVSDKPPKPRVMAVYQKSEPGATRLFSMDVLAYCSRAGEDASLFDYSVDEKCFLSEERIFRDVRRVQNFIGLACASLDDPELLARLLTGIQDGKAPFEEQSLGAALGLSSVHSAEAWKTAWCGLYGPNAVISVPGLADETARATFGMNPITVVSPNLRAFLEKCGVPSAKSFLSTFAPDRDYELVELDEDQERRKTEVFTAVFHEWPRYAHLPVHAYHPLTAAMAGNEGFLAWDDARKPTGIFVRSDMFDRKKRLMVVAVHELRHARTGANDFTKEFEEQADQVEARLMMEKYSIEDDPSEVDTELEQLREFHKEKTGA